MGCGLRVCEGEQGEWGVVCGCVRVNRVRCEGELGEM